MGLLQYQMRVCGTYMIDKSVVHSFACPFRHALVHLQLLNECDNAAGLHAALTVFETAAGTHNC